MCVHQYHKQWFLVLFQTIKIAEKHLELVKAEHSHYRSVCKTSADNLKSCFGSDNIPSPGSMVPANTHAITLHYSFDMAQQVT